ncbi:MAG TPA: peptidylprolyl isomerase [Acidimicrobiales bacterium]|nr:peptidylprolyl isomerase [Acidimicrobiales bacterium]
MKRLLPLALLGALAVSATACDAAPNAAVVNGVAISQSQLLDDLSTIVGGDPSQITPAACMLQLQGASVPLPGNGVGDDTVTQALAAYQLTTLVIEELVHQRLAQLGHQVTAADIAAAQTDLTAQLSPSSTQGTSPCGLSGAQLAAQVPAGFYHRQVVALAEQEKLAAIVGNVDLSTGAMAAYYQAHPQEFQLICLSDIAVNTQAQAAQLRQAITSGSTSFEAAATQNSVDTQTAPNGGQIPCVPMSQVQNQVILGAISGLKPGDVSQPVNNPASATGGQSVWLLLKIDDEPVVPFSQAQSQIRQELLAAQNNQVTAEFSRLTHSSDVTVNPQYGSWSKLAGVRSPTPPPARDLLSPFANIPGGSGSSAAG